MTSADLEIRPLRENEEYSACVRLQRLVWGEAFSEEVPLAILKVGQRIGGVTAGAFDGSELVGFVFGLTGIEDGRLVHWSDMLAVRPDARDRGVGRRLKEFQRQRLLDLGVETMYWTFDPLVSRNAYLNLAVLGATATEYVVDMYGVDTSSELHRGLGTDRLVARWAIADRTIGGPSVPGYTGDPVDAVVVDGAAPTFRSTTVLAEPPILGIPVPPDIGAVQEESLDLAAAWRAATREAFTTALGRGYSIASFERPAAGGPGRYLLVRDRDAGS
jgi:predicted GNAT superfamily acetyltransferase